jgi:predicted  nucleic acid-binding Zn-ribbon protein
MKAKKIAPIFILIVLSIVSAIAAKEEKKQLSGTYSASCMIKIIADRQILEPGAAENNVFSILQSSGIGVKAAKDILGFKPEELTSDALLNIIKTELFQNFSYSRGRQSIDIDSIYTFRLKTDANPAPVPAAQEFMQVIIDGLRQNLNRAFEDYRNRLYQQIKNAEESAASTEKDFYSLQKQMRELSGSRDFSRKAILADINSLQKQTDRLTIDISESEAYLENSTKQISECRARAEEKVKTNALISEMENMIKAQQQEVDSLRNKRGGEGGEQDPALSAREKLSHLKIELGNRKEEVFRNSGGNRIDNLNEEIANASPRINGDKKKLEFLQQRLVEAQKLLEKADEYEVLSIKADITKMSLKDCLQKLEGLKQGANLIPPTITVMGAE